MKKEKEKYLVKILLQTSGTNLLAVQCIEKGVYPSSKPETQDKRKLLTKELFNY